MSNYFNAEAAKANYSQKPSEELVRIAYVDSEDMLPEAVELARAELSSRGIASDDQFVEEEREVLEAERARAAELADEPLGVGLKIVCFLLADVVAIIIALVKRSNGKVRASNDAWRFLAYGWLFRLGLILWGMMLN